MIKAQRIFTVLRSSATSVRCSSTVPTEISISQSSVNPTVTQLHGETTLQPLEHTSKQIGLFYRLPDEKINKLFRVTGIPKFYQPMLEGLAETKLLIREPAVSVIDYVRRANYDARPNRYMLYGEHGVGKSMSMMHITHFLSEQKFILFYAYNPVLLLRNPGELLPSGHREGMYDHTTDAVQILAKFKDQNEHLINELELKTTRKYEWNQRESTNEGEPLMTLVEFGMNRAKYASDCFYYLVNEMKGFATQKKCRVALVYDGINMLFIDKSSFWKGARPKVNPQNYTIFEAFHQLLLNDWTNGCVVGTIERHCNHHEQRQSYLPRYMLGQKGWEMMEPFVPIEVKNYSQEEFHQVINYYLDRSWLSHPASATATGRNEIEFLSGYHPLTVYRTSMMR